MQWIAVEHLGDILGLIVGGLLCLFNKQAVRGLKRHYHSIGWYWLSNTNEKHVRLVLIICGIGIFVLSALSLMGAIRPQGGPP